MKIIKGNLILEKDTKFDESIVVKGLISCKLGFRYSLKVIGNIDAQNINTGNINAGNINAEDIDAEDINAWNIDAEFILCNKINVKSRLMAYSLIEDRNKFEEKKDWKREYLGDEK